MPIFQFFDQSKNIERTFLFIHIPKTAGTSIEFFFENLNCKTFLSPKDYRFIRNYLKVAPTHYDFQLIDKIIDLKKIYSFSIVRNPIDRTISIFNWLKYNTAKSERFSSMEIEDFCNYIFTINPINEPQLFNMVKPQYKFISKELVKVFRLEDGLENILSDVLKDVGLIFNGSLNIPFLKQSNFKNKNLALNRKTINLIKEFYKNDFLNFNY